MDAQFRAQYTERGRRLNVMGYSVTEMDTEDLYAVIGFLLDLSHDRDPETKLAQVAPLGSPPGTHLPAMDPPKNDGLVEG